MSWPLMPRKIPISVDVAIPIAVSLALCCSACSKSNAPHSRAESQSGAQEFRYLTDQTMPNSISLLAPPPAPGSAAMVRDETARRGALLLHGTPRYVLAVADTDRHQDATNRAFQCTFGVDIGPEQTPVLYKLLAKMRIDVRASTYPAKSHFKRPRPWVANKSQVCAASEQLVRDDGSYPSARAAVGWAYALVLSKLNPARRAMIMQRGREFGQSRIICDAEWQSDVDAGRLVAVAVVDRLQKTTQFKSDLSAARKEVEKSLIAGRKAQANCE
jgi:acid phosphatase (class A)